MGLSHWYKSGPPKFRATHSSPSREEESRKKEGRHLRVPPFPCSPAKGDVWPIGSELEAHPQIEGSRVWQIGDEGPARRKTLRQAEIDIPLGALDLP